MDETALGYKATKNVATIFSALSAAAVLALVTLPDRSNASFWASVLFAVSAPTLAGFVITLETSTKRQRKSLSWLVPLLAVVGLLSTFGGLLQIFRLLSTEAAWVFGITSFVVGVLYIVAMYAREKA